jgi:hypothetical protein
LREVEGEHTKSNNTANHYSYRSVHSSGLFPGRRGLARDPSVKRRLGWQVRQIYHGTNLDRALPSYRNSSGDGNGFIKIHHVN